VLGEGGMGTVYRARDERLDRTVVLKVPHPRFLAEAGFRERFERETKSLLLLEHPHIVKVHDVGAVRGVPFTVLQHLSGGSLLDRVRRAGGRLPVMDVLSWLSAVAEALDFVHELGVVHRDCKPGNVLFDDRGHAYLADFGIAKALAAAERDDEKPARRVTVSSFLIARDEVTLAQWDRFCDETRRKKLDRPKGSKGDHPVSSVSWMDARAWCAWAGLRLPTEAEWERAARGGVDGLIFAWGDAVLPRVPLANVFDESRARGVPRAAGKPHFSGYDDGFPSIAPVGSFPPNAFALRDTTGNVWEWCADVYDPKAYTRLPLPDPVAASSPDEKGPRVQRGGALNSPPPDCRLARRGADDPESHKDDDVGFRLARDAR
jgi:sulfatase modifying factor 1